MIRKILWSMVLLLAALPALAACDPAIQVNISRPLGTEADPVSVAATATSGCAVTLMRVYVDYKLVYEQHMQNSIGARLVMGPGAHRVAVNAWNSAGAVAHQEVFTTSTADPVEPLWGCEVGNAYGAFYTGDLIPWAVPSPARVGMVGRAEALKITSMRMYIDGVDRVQVWGSSASCLPAAFIAMNPGYHFINVQAWDSAGYIHMTGSILQITK